MEFVLDDPEPAGRMNANRAFFRKDGSTGKIFRIEVSPKLSGKRHQVRSVHELTDLQYQKEKDRLTRSQTASPDPVRQERMLKAGGRPNMKNPDPFQKTDQVAVSRYETSGNARSTRTTVENGNRPQADFSDRRKNGNTVSDFLRYDSTENADVKFSIIGERGARQAITSLEAQNPEVWKMLGISGDMAARHAEAVARLENLDTARAMLAAGKEMKVVKFATGWEKGGDGKWRTETDDVEIRLLNSGVEKLRAGETVRLRQLVEASDLFDAYPDMREIAVMRYSSLSGNAMYHDNVIALSPDALESVDTILHEIQHAIQAREGFAPGGSPGGIPDSMLQSEADRERMDEIDSELRELNRIAATNAERERTEIGRGWTDHPESLAVYDRIDALENERSGLMLRRTPRREAYRRLGGEVEARNAAARRTMPLAERLQTLLSETEDVAESDKIYLARETGKALLAIDADLQRKLNTPLPEMDSSVEDGQHPYYRNTLADFSVISPELTEALFLASTGRKALKEGESIEIGGRTYTLDHISFSAYNPFFRQRGLSIYYRTGDSIVRLSDHWSNTGSTFVKSRKLNCGRISSCLWNLNGAKNTDLVDMKGHQSGKYPWRIIGGEARLKDFRVDDCHGTVQRRSGTTGGGGIAGKSHLPAGTPLRDSAQYGNPGSADRAGRLPAGPQSATGKPSLRHGRPAGSAPRAGASDRGIRLRRSAQGTEHHRRNTAERKKLSGRIESEFSNERDCR